MRKNKETGLDFVVDKLTNSIENVITGDSFATEISILTTNDLKAVNKKDGWLFNWRIEYMNPVKDVYKLTIVNNPTVIQGLVSLEVKEDHVFMPWLKMRRSIKAKQKCMQVWREIWWHLRVNYHFSADTKAMFPLFRKPN